MSKVGSTWQKDAQAWLRIRVLVDFGGRFLRAKRKPEPPQSGIRVRRQACAGGWMELGTLTGAGAGSDKKDRAGVSEPAGYIDRC